MSARRFPVDVLNFRAGLLSKARPGFLAGADEPCFAQPIARARFLCSRAAGRDRRTALDQRRHRDHLDAVYRARCHAQLTTGAFREQHGVHALGRTDDRVDRTGLDTERAADAPLLVDQRRGERLFDAMRRVERDHCSTEQRREPGDALCAARRTLVDLRVTARYRLGVRPAAAEPALRALGLRQEIVYPVG